MSKFVNEIGTVENVHRDSPTGILAIDKIADACVEAFGIYADAIEDLIKEREHVKDRNSTEEAR